LENNNTRVLRWQRRKRFLLFLYSAEFLLLRSAGDSYTTHHEYSALTSVFYIKDLDRVICSFL